MESIEAHKTTIYQGRWIRVNQSIVGDEVSRLAFAELENTFDNCFEERSHFTMCNLCQQYNIRHKDVGRPSSQKFATKHVKRGAFCPQFRFVDTLVVAH